MGASCSSQHPSGQGEPPTSAGLSAVEQGKLGLSGAAPADGTHPSRWHTAVSGDIWMSTIRSS